MQRPSMTEKEITPGEAAFALWTLERLLLGVGPLMSLQVL
jgi:hypothetical protein